MIALVAGAVALVAAAAAWARFGAGRAERHSVESYEHVLDVLGDVAKRGESAAPVHAPSQDELARPHVRPSGGSERVRPLIRSEVPIPRLRLRPPPVVGQVAGIQPPPAVPEELVPGQPIVGRLGLSGTTPTEPLEAEVVISFDDLPEVEVGSSSRISGRPIRTGQGNLARRAATGAAAAVVLGALGVGGWQLASTRGGSHPVSPSNSNTPAPAKQPSVAPISVEPSRITPTSITSSLVTYTIPSASYTVSFKATGRCWLGIQREVGGSYLWMDTLLPGGAATYPTQGAVIVYIGAPGTVSIDVNGIPVSLPPGNVQPYRVSLTPQSSPST